MKIPNKVLVVIFCLLTSSLVFAQDVEVKFDKLQDFSVYKTFSITSGKVFTPKEERQFNASTLKQWIESAIAHELESRGLQRVDSVGDLSVDYFAGAMDKSDFQDLGPMGYLNTMNPMDYSSRTWVKEYREGSLFVDLTDAKSKKAVWSATCIADVTNIKKGQREIDSVVRQAFKKLKIKAKKK